MLCFSPDLPSEFLYSLPLDVKLPYHYELQVHTHTKWPCLDSHIKADETSGAPLLHLNTKKIQDIIDSGLISPLFRPGPSHSI